MALCEEDDAIRSLITSPLADVLPVVTLPFFLDLFPGRRKEAEWIATYVSKHGEVPKASHFKKHFPSSWDGTKKSDPLLHTVGEVQNQLLDTLRAKYAKDLTDLFDKKPTDTTAHTDMLDKFAQALRIASTLPGVKASADIDNRTQQVLADIAKDPLLALSGIPTGFLPLDRELGGSARAGQLIVLAALVNLGKTYVFCKLAENMRAAGKRVLFIPLEMTATDIMDRCLCVRYKLNADWYIKKEKPATETASLEAWYTDLLKKRLALEQATTGPGKIFVEEPVGPCNANMLRAWIRQHNAEVVIIDAAQDIWDNKKTPMRVERLYNAMEELKMLASEMKLPIFLSVQLSAAVEKQGIKQGNVNNIAWAQVFAQKAHVVLTMLGDRSTCTREVTTDKNRDGNVGRKWEVVMTFPEVEIEARDLQPVGITVNPEDVFDDAEAIAKLFESPEEDKKQEKPVVPPRSNMVPARPPATKVVENTSESASELGSGQTLYQEERKQHAKERSMRRLKRRAIR